MSFDVRGKAALVTGSNRGIGNMVSGLRLAQESFARGVVEAGITVGSETSRPQRAEDFPI